MKPVCYPVKFAHLKIPKDPYFGKVDKIWCPICRKVTDHDGYNKICISCNHNIGYSFYKFHVYSGRKKK